MGPTLFVTIWESQRFMSCTPKFNYILQALPVRIPLKYFKRFDKLCNKFLWNGKRPRLNLHKLQRPVDQGGLGIPNLLLYYYALVSDILPTGACLQSKLRPGTASKALYAMRYLPSTSFQQYCLKKRRLIPYLRTCN